MVPYPQPRPQAVTILYSMAHARKFSSASEYNSLSATSHGSAVLYSSIYCEICPNFTSGSRQAHLKFMIASFQNHSEYNSKGPIISSKAALP